MRQRLIRAMFVGVVVVGLFAFCAKSARAQGAGETLFKTKCAACYGRTAKAEFQWGKNWPSLA